MFFIFAFITYSNTEWEAVVDNVLVGGDVVFAVVVVVVEDVVGVVVVVVVVVVKDVVLSRSHATRNNIRNKNNF